MKPSARGVAARIGAAWRALTGRGSQTYGAWAATDVNRLFNDWIASAMTADEEIRWSIRRLRDRARDLGRNNPYVCRYLGLLAENIVGPCGITLQAQVRNNDGRLNKMLNDRIEDGWAEWSMAPTIDGRLSRVQVEHLQIKGTGRDGESFTRIWRGYPGNKFGLALEPLDPDLLDEEYNVPGSATRNEIRMGIEVNRAGAPQGYHFWTVPHSSFAVRDQQRIRIPADEIIHLFDPERVHQSRGVPWIAPVMGGLHMLDKYEEAALVGARVGAAQTMWFVRQQDANSPTPKGDDQNRIAMDVEPGQMAFAPPGYTVESVKPNYPNTEHGAFTKEMKRRIATGLDCTYEELCNDRESVNYSSIRAGMLGVRDTWRRKQYWFVDAFERRVYTEFIAMSTLTGAVVLDSRDFSRFLDVRFSPRGWSWVDPLKDTEASIAGIQNGLASRTKVLAEQGLDFEEILEDLQNEKKLAAQYKVEITEPQAAAAAPTKPKPEDDDDDDDEKPNRNGYAHRLLGALRGGS